MDREDIHTLGGWILYQNPNLKKGKQSNIMATYSRLIK
ncbi:hypothetical protein AAHB53_08045 [Niallia circulans]